MYQAVQPSVVSGASGGLPQRPSVGTISQARPSLPLRPSTSLLQPTAVACGSSPAGNLSPPPLRRTNAAFVEPMLQSPVSGASSSGNLVPPPLRRTKAHFEAPGMQPHSTYVGAARPAVTAMKAVSPVSPAVHGASPTTMLRRANTTFSPSVRHEQRVDSHARVSNGIVSARRAKVAILGGAFDPPTMNHLLGAAEVIHSGMADEMWIMPCAFRPDKPHLSKPLDRYIMCELSVNTFFSPDMPIRVSDYEVFQPENVATYDSLSGLRDKYPDKEFAFVIGTDWLQPGTDLRTWTSKDPVTGGQVVTGDKLVSEFDFLVIQRPGYDVEDLSEFGPRMIRLLMPEGTNLMEGSLSSTEVRKRSDISNRVSNDARLIEGLVTTALLSFIERHTDSFGRRCALYSKNATDRPRLPTHSGLSRDEQHSIAVFGGTFDPPTNSHMISLAEIVHSGVADQVILVPCGRRADKPHLRSTRERYTMCQLACASSFTHNLPVTVSDLEVEEPEALATYDLLCALREANPNSKLKFVVGSDWLQKREGQDIRKWVSKDKATGRQIVTGERLLNEFDFIVIKRPGYDVKDIADFGPRMKWLEMHGDQRQGMKYIQSNMSSAEVRQRATISYKDTGNLQLIDGLVPTGVFNYIKREQIYKPQSNI